METKTKDTTVWYKRIIWNSKKQKQKSFKKDKIEEIEKMGKNFKKYGDSQLANLCSLIAECFKDEKV
jgi:hypothetical protein